MTTIDTFNKFKPTTVGGTFYNDDSPDGSLLADAIFKRNATIQGNLILDTNVSIKVNDVYQTIPASQLLETGSSSATLDIIDQFAMFYDQFTPGSIYEWAFL